MAPYYMLQDCGLLYKGIWSKIEVNMSNYFLYYYAMVFNVIG